MVRFDSNLNEVAVTHAPEDYSRSDPAYFDEDNVIVSPHPEPPAADGVEVVKSRPLDTENRDWLSKHHRPSQPFQSQPLQDRHESWQIERKEE